MAAGQQSRGLAGLTPAVEERHAKLRGSHGCANTMAATDTANSFPATVQGGPVSQSYAAELQHIPTSPQF